MGYVKTWHREYTPQNYFDDPALNEELATVSATINNLLYWLKRVLRDDGFLARATVGLEAFTAEVNQIIGFVYQKHHGNIDPDVGFVPNAAQIFEEKIGKVGYWSASPKNIGEALVELAKVVGQEVAQIKQNTETDYSLFGFYRRLNRLEAKVNLLSGAQGGGVDVAAITEAIQVLREEIVGGAAPERDTLKKLSDALDRLRDDMQAMGSAVGKTLRYDVAQTLLGDEKAQVWANLGLAEAVDFAAVYQEALA